MLLNDMAWIIFIAPVGHDRRPEPAAWRSRSTSTGAQPPIFPRWVGYVLRRHRGGDRARRPWRPSSRPARSPGTGWCRSGCATAPTPLFVVVMFFVVRAALHRQAVEEGGTSASDCGRQRPPSTSRDGASRPESATTRRRASAIVWIVFWIVPAFYTAFGVIFFALTRVMPPPRPDITDRSDGAVLPQPLARRFRSASGC